jgi:hypothetical protein
MWAQRLKRVFAIDIEVCRCCGSRSNVKIQDSLKLEGSLD